MPIKPVSTMATKGITRLAKKIGIDNLTILLIEDFVDIPALLTIYLFCFN